MKYCTHCGKELMDEAVMCPGCGNTFESDAVQVPAPKKKMSKKKILLIIASAVLLLALIVGGIFAWRYFKIEQVKNDLAGNTYSFIESQTYSDKEIRYSFDDWDADCTYSCDFIGLMDTVLLYDKSYTVEFKNGKVYLNFGSEILGVQYNEYGEIKQLRDIDTDDVYKLR